MSFLEKLEAAAQRNRSLLCVGLDPWLAHMPIGDIATFNLAIVEATSDLVCAYKPNIAFYEAEGPSGLQALADTLSAIPSHVPVILDAKRGDIGSTAAAYARAVFEQWGADATTVNAYAGRDAVEPFLEYADRGVLVWCRSSNSGAAELQSLQVLDGIPLYEQVARLAQEWNPNGNVGVVVGATYPEELGRVRAICPEMPILVPGVGAQAGELGASVKAGVDAHGRRAIVSASRQVLHASKEADYAEAARRSAQDLRGQINGVLEEMGYGW